MEYFWDVFVHLWLLAIVGGGLVVIEVLSRIKDMRRVVGFRWSMILLMATALPGVLRRVVYWHDAQVADFAAQKHTSLRTPKAACTRSSWSQEELRNRLDPLGQ